MALWQALLILGAGTMVTIAYISSVTAMRVGDIGFIAPFQIFHLRCSGPSCWAGSLSIPCQIPIR